MDLQAAERFVPDSALVPTACHSLTGGSSNPPKFGTLIPNRIFVGGIPSNTTEQELKSFFSSFGQVKDVKIISDRLGVSKGSYGFVTFESQEMAEKIIKNESETLIFKDRKLNIGHAIRKQQMFPRTDLPTALFFAGGAVPYGFQNGMAFLSIPGQEYPVLSQATAPYATMMLPQQGNAAAMYLPSLQSAVSANTSPYASLSQQQVAAALQQQQQQQFHNTGSSVGLNPAVASQLNQVASATASNLGAQSNSTAAVMAAAAAAMAAVQWPTQATCGQQSTHQLTNVVSTSSGSQNANGPQALVQSSITPQQAAAVAAAMAAQQTPWRWSPIQHQSQPTSNANSSSNHGSNSSATITVSSNLNNNTSTPTAPNPNLHNNHQQVSNPSISFVSAAIPTIPAVIPMAETSIVQSNATLLAALQQQTGYGALTATPDSLLGYSATSALALALASVNNTSLNDLSLIYPGQAAPIDISCKAQDSTHLDLGNLYPTKKARYDDDHVETKQPHA